MIARGNSLLLLVRYRTGDYGLLIRGGDSTATAYLEGREPVRLTGTDGTPVPSVDLTQQLQARGWTVHQRDDGATAVVVAGPQPWQATPLQLVRLRTVNTAT